MTSLTIQTSVSIDQIAAALTAEQMAQSLLKKLQTPSTPQQRHTSTPPKVGEMWPEQGGIYAGVMRGEAGKPDYHLIIAESSAGEASLNYGAAGKTVEGAHSNLDGLANTSALADANESYPAADFAYRLHINGFSDWYLPARHELRLAYINAFETFEVKAWYWSSTQCAGYSDYAWGQGFDDGNQDDGNKSFEGRARAVRRFLID
jgi:hypothetical protein